MKTKRINIIDLFFIYLLRILFSCILIGVSLLKVQATDLTWTGAIDDNWHNLDNWSPAQLPSFDDNVTIDAFVTITGTSVARAKTMKIMASGELFITSSASLIIIDENTDYGITLSGRINNQGTLVIESADGGISSSGIFGNTGSISIENIDGTGIYLSSGSFFQNDGTINIDSVAPYGILNFGEVKNIGIIDIGYVEVAGISNPYAINNSSIFTNDPCGYLILDSGLTASSASSFTNEGWIENLNGDLVVNSSSTFDNIGVIEDRNGPSDDIGNINNTGLIFNPINSDLGIGDTITIAEGSASSLVQGDSLYLDSLLSTSVGFYNTSTLEWKIGAEALNSSTFYLEISNGTCSDTISIILTSDVLECSSDNTFLGSFSQLWTTDANWSTSSIPLACENVIIDGSPVIISNGTDAVARSVSYSSSQDSLTIEIGASLSISHGSAGIDMSNNAYLNNAGTLNLVKINGHGITGSLQCEILNSGAISMDSIEGSGIYDTDRTTTHLTNSGKIEFNYISGDGIVIGGDVINTDSIIMSSIGGVGIHGNGNGAFMSCGYISIQDAKNGVYFEDEFENNGQLFLLSIEDKYAMYLEDTGTNSGDIVVNGSPETCIYSAVSFSNTGNMIISSPANVGIVNGLSSGSAKETTVKSFSGGSYAFYNSGTIVLEDDFEFAISNNQGIENDTCGAIYCTSSIQNLSDWLNNGLLVLTGSEIHDILDTISNYGVINDIQKSISDLDSIYIDNHGCFFNGPLQNTYIVEESSTSVFNDINDPINLGDYFYLDKDLTEKAGTYDQSTNTWTPSRASINQDSFYLGYEGLGGNCMDTILITIATVVEAPLCDSLNFTQAASGFWNASSNWDLLRAPDTCDIVLIPSGMSVGTTIGDTAFCNLITIDSSAAFQVPSGGVFIVNE